MIEDDSLETLAALREKYTKLHHFVLKVARLQYDPTVFRAFLIKEARTILDEVEK